MIAAIWDEPALLTAIGGIAAVVVGFLGYRRSKHADAVAEKAGLASGSAQSIEQAMDGLNALVERLNDYIAILQADRTVDKADIARLTAQRDQLQADLLRMRRKYGNGNGGSFGGEPAPPPPEG